MDTLKLLVQVNIRRKKYLISPLVIMNMMKKMNKISETFWFSMERLLQLKMKTRVFQKVMTTVMKEQTIKNSMIIGFKSTMRM